MSTSERAINRWTNVVLVYSAIQTQFPVLAFSARNESPFFFGIFWGHILITSLFWIGVVLIVRKEYSAARKFLLIGGILAFPLGLIMIIAGNSMKRAADTATQ